MHFQSRRRFLQRAAQSGGGILGLPILERLLAADAPAKPLRVIVVGAGLAGLVSAYELERKGHAVTLLEADPKHLGGRVRTHHFADGRTGELGAMRIPKQHDLTRQYAKDFGLKLRRFVQTNPEAYCAVRGKKVRHKDTATLSTAYKLDGDEKGKTSDALWERAVTDAWKILTEAERKDLFAVSPQTKAVRDLDRFSLRQLFEKAKLSEEAIEFLSVTQSEETLFHTAATEVLRDEILEVYSQDLDEIVGGMERLPLTFASRLKSKARLGCEVTEIRQNTDKGTVEATYSEGSKDSVVEGDYLICTLPFSVLERMKFFPALSGAKQRAIRVLHYESGTKVLLDCNSRFWETKDGIYGGGTITDLPTGMTYYPSDNSVDKSAKVSEAGGVLLASYTWGMAARRMAAGTDADAVKTTVRHVASLHPELAEKGAIRESAVWNWDKHRWAAGAFCWFLPGQHTELHRHILEPEGRIVFAGEHTSLNHSWMQGALESGIRAVQVVVNKGRLPK